MGTSSWCWGPVSLLRHWEARIHPTRATTECIRLVRVSVDSWMCSLLQNWAGAPELKPPTSFLNKRTFRTRFDDSLLKSHWESGLFAHYTNAGGSQALRGRFAGAAHAFVWVKTLHSWHSSAGSKTLWVTHLLYGRLIATTLRTYPSLLLTWLLTYASDSNHGRMRFEPYTQSENPSRQQK